MRQCIRFLMVVQCIITNSGLKQHTLTILQFWRSEVQKYFGMSVFFVETQGENPFPSCSLLVSRGGTRCLLHCIILTPTSVVESQSLTLTLIPLSDKDLCDYIASTQIIQDNFLITHHYLDLIHKIPLPQRVTFQGSECELFWGAIIPPKTIREKKNFSALNNYKDD